MCMYCKIVTEMLAIIFIYEYMIFIHVVNASTFTYSTNHVIVCVDLILKRLFIIGIQDTRIKTTKLTAH